MCGWLRYASAQETQWSYVQNTFSGHCPRLLDDKMESQFGFQILRLSCSGTKYRFSAFWLRSKCSICSYQLNIWYGSHVFPSILIWFLTGDGDLGLALALSQVSLVLQYHQDGPLPHWKPGSHARQVTSVVLFILFLEILPRKDLLFAGKKKLSKWRHFIWICQTRSFDLI